MVTALTLLFGCLLGSGTPDGAAPPELPPFPGLLLLPPPLLLLLHAAAVLSASIAATLIDTVFKCMYSRPSQARAQKALAAPWHMFPGDWKSVARALSSL